MQAETEPVAAAARTEPTGWLDLARVLAIGAVVMVHESGAAVGRRGPGVPATPAWLAADLLDAASRWCVPVFVMVSGALLLDPSRTEPAATFYRRRLARIGLPLVVWTAVYLVFAHLYLHRLNTPADVVRAVGSGSPFLQLYFLYVIAGLYLLTPFLRAALRSLDRRGQAGFAAALLGIGMADRVLSDFAGVGEANLATRWLAYAGYFVAGWVLRDVAFRPRWTRWALVALPVSVAATAAGGVVAAGGGRGWGRYGEYVLAYVSPSVAVMSLAVFWLLRTVGTRGDGWRPGPWTRRLSDLTFGVFLVHALLWYPLVLNWRVPSGLLPYLGTAAWHWGLVVAVSALATAALRMVPGVRRLV